MDAARALRASATLCLATQRREVFSVSLVSTCPKLDVVDASGKSVVADRRPAEQSSPYMVEKAPEGFFVIARHLRRVSHAPADWLARGLPMFRVASAASPLWPRRPSPAHPGQTPSPDRLASAPSRLTPPPEPGDAGRSGRPAQSRGWWGSAGGGCRCAGSRWGQSRRRCPVRVTRGGGRSRGSVTPRRWCRSHRPRTRRGRDIPMGLCMSAPARAPRMGSWLRWCGSGWRDHRRGRRRTRGILPGRRWR